MKFGFVTCVELGLSCIKTLYQCGETMEVLITLHDHKGTKKSGRIYLDEFSHEHKIELVKTNHINSPEVLNAIKKHQIDWLFIIGWSQIAATHILKAPKFGCIGIHPTLLPEGRGRAAVPWAIIKGLSQTGITMFRLDEGVDTGEIIAQQVIPIQDDETATSLYNKVNTAHETLMASICPKILNNNLQFKKQDHSQSTYWEARTPADGELKSTMSTIEVDRLVRATTRPYPGAFLIKENKKIIIWKGKINNSKSNSKNLSLDCANGIYEVEDFSVEELEINFKSGKPARHYYK
jgi:methionyl-tRNA formyltransferase